MAEMETTTTALDHLAEARRRVAAAMQALRNVREEKAALAVDAAVDVPLSPCDDAAQLIAAVDVEAGHAAARSARLQALERGELRLTRTLAEARVAVLAAELGVLEEAARGLAAEARERTRRFAEIAELVLAAAADLAATAGHREGILQQYLARASQIRRLGATPPDPPAEVTEAEGAWNGMPTPRGIVQALSVQLGPLAFERQELAALQEASAALTARLAEPETREDA